jgi:hypothetical protein
MLAGPAIFGAFVASTPRGAWWLLLGVAIFIGWVDFDGKSSTGSDSYAYYVPQFALLSAAGVISIIQLQRDKGLRDMWSANELLTQFNDDQLRALGEAILKEVKRIREASG